MHADTTGLGFRVHYRSAVNGTVGGLDMLYWKEYAHVLPAYNVEPHLSKRVILKTELVAVTGKDNESRACYLYAIALFVLEGQLQLRAVGVRCALYTGFLSTL